MQRSLLAWRSLAQYGAGTAFPILKEMGCPILRLRSGQALVAPRLERQGGSTRTALESHPSTFAGRKGGATCVRFQIGVLRLRPIDARGSPRCSFPLPDPGDCLKRFSNQ